MNIYRTELPQNVKGRAQALRDAKVASILGLHPAPIDENGRVTGPEQVRVRYFVESPSPESITLTDGMYAVDEDMDMPELQMGAPHTTEVVASILRPQILARHRELADLAKG